MKKIVVSSLVACLFLVSCKQKSKNDESAAVNNPSADSATANRTNLPVNSFIQEDRDKVESFAAGILKKSTIDGKMDSSFIQLAEFKTLSRQFDLPGFDSAYFTNHYTETSFLEQNTNTVQFLYSAREASNPVRKIILYVKQSDAGDKVDMIYVERDFNYEDTATSQRLTWKMGHYFIIATNQETPGGYRKNSKDQVIWESADFGIR